MKLLELKISISVESYDEKTAENYRNCYVAEKRIVSKFKLTRSQICIAQIEDLNEVCVKNSRLYLLYFPRNKPSESVTVRVWLGGAWPARFIVLNDSASNKMVLKI